jgi:alkylation response protein AidB-like acyl-CoA dehydrogenase
MHELTRSQFQIQKAARDFAKGEFDKDLALDMDKKHKIPNEILKAAADLGFLGIHFDTRYSGGGMGLFENTLIAEELCRKDSSIGSALMLATSGAEALLRFGSEDLKQKFLPGIVDGQLRPAAAFTGVGTKGVLSGQKVTAVRDGNDFIINGDKTFVLNGNFASFYCVLCQTFGDEKSDKDFSLILVEADRDGVHSEKMGETTGLRMTPFSDLHLKNVKVPISNLLGKEGNGVDHANACMDENLILIASIALGTAQGALERAIDYTRQRVQFGRKIAGFEVTQHKIADMATKVESARLFTYHAAICFDKKSIDPKIPAMAKMVSTRAAVEVADEAIQLLGGYGYMAEYEVERFYRDAKALELLQGPGGAQKNIIAKKVIGRI